MSEPRTHYQISLTSRQAVGLFAALLAALGLAYFFGLMTGLSGRDAQPSEKLALAEPPAGAKPAPSSEPAVPPVETGLPLAGSGAPPHETVVTAPPAEPTTPATLHPFDDAAEEERAGPSDSGSRTSVVGAPAAPAKASAAPPKAASKGAPASKVVSAQAAGKVWVQAASLSSHEEANALGARLSRHGFPAVVLPGSGPKGRIYRVRVGPYHSEEEASRAVTKLSRQERIHEPWIVPEGK